MHRIGITTQIIIRVGSKLNLQEFVVEHGKIYYFTHDHLKKGNCLYINIYVYIYLYMSIYI